MSFVPSVFVPRNEPRTILGLLSLGTGYQREYDPAVRNTLATSPTGTPTASYGMVRTNRGRDRWQDSCSCRGLMWVNVGTLTGTWCAVARDGRPAGVAAAVPDPGLQI